VARWRAMRLAHRAPDLIELRGRSAARSPLLIGAALLAGPTLMPFVLEPHGITADRVSAASILCAVATVLLVVGWPKRRSVWLRPREGTFQVDDQPPIHLAEDAAFRLTPAPPAAPTGPRRYGVSLVSRTSEICLIAADDPSAALRDLQELRLSVDLPVVSGWGLPRSGVPWVDESAGPDSPTAGGPSDEELDAVGRRRIATTLLVGAAGVVTLLSYQISRRLAQGDPLTAVSGELPLIAVFILVIVGSGFATAGIRFELGAELVYRRRIWGVTFAKAAVWRSAVRSAYVVSPRAGAARHVLFDTNDGPVAFPCDPAGGTDIVQRLEASRLAS
jgi:hypothetical protein